MCGECVLALQAAAQDLDGGGLVVSGAQVAQARRRRASDCGAAAHERWGSARAAAQWRARARRRLGVASRRRVSGGSGAVYGRGCRGDGFARSKKQTCETDAWDPRKS